MSDLGNEGDVGHGGGDEGFPVAELLDLLDHEDVLVQQHAIAALPQLAAGDVPDSLATGLLERASDPARAASGRDTLAALYAALFATHRPHDALLAALASDAEHERIVAARALGWRGNEGAVPALVRTLTDDASAAREAAAEALGEIGGELAEGALLDLLEQLGLADDVVPTAAVPADGAERLREIAVRGLRGAAGAAAQDAVLAQLRAGRARLAALASLRRFEVISTTTDVRACLSDPDARVRLLALSVLECHGGPADREIVLDMCLDSDARVQRMARETAAALGA